MSTDPSTLEVGRIQAVVVRKPVKNLHLSILPPLGKVRVTAPLYMGDDAIRTFLATRLPWIKKQQREFEEQERQTRREYVSGENHYLWGKRYRLEVVYEKKPPCVSIRGRNRLLLSVRPDSDRVRRERAMMDWYRSELRSVAGACLECWQKTMGIQVNSWGIRRMKTRWGTCNQKARRILLNLELAKKPEHCLDFIIVHELTHFLERKHNDGFKAYMDTFLPLWRRYREELNRAALSHERWKY